MVKALYLIAEILIIITGVYCFWIQLCAIVGFFLKKKKAPYAKPQRIAVISCARNEEKVIGTLIDSINKQNYPQDKVKTFVVAHNCIDDTAKEAEKHGAVVFIRNNPNDTCKGDALRYGINQIKELYPDEFDIIAVFDADNVAGRDFLKEINGAIANGADAAQGFRASKNRYQNWITQLFATFWLSILYYQNMPHTFMKLPSTVGGTGFAFKADALGDDGWHTYTMLEDIEFATQQALMGHKIVSAPAAVFYDEQPSTLRMALLQRFRWSIAGTDLMKGYLIKVIKYIPKGKLSAIKLLLELLTNPMLTCSILGGFLMFFTQLATGVPIQNIVCGFIKASLFVWLMSIPLVLVVLFKEKEKLTKNLSSVFLFWIFMFLSFVFAVLSFFVRKRKWEPIEHNCTVSIDDLEQKDEHEEYVKK